MPATSAISTDRSIMVSGGGGRNIYGTSDVVESGLTVSQAIERAGLNYEVVKRDLFKADGTPVSKFKMLGREDDPASEWGMVTDRYQITQNQRGFEVVEYMVQQGITVEAAGKIGDGRKAWMMLVLPEDLVVAGDALKGKVLAYFTHDGSGALTFANTALRLSCTNMLPMFIGRNAPQSFKVRHTGDMEAKMQEALNAMGVTHAYFEAFKALGDELGQKRITDRKLKKMLEALYPAGTTDKQAANAEERRDLVRRMVTTGTGLTPDNDNLAGHENTAWAFVNAVGEVADWGSNRQRDRIDRLTYSSPDVTIKNRALQIVTSMN